MIGYDFSQNYYFCLINDPLRFIDILFFSENQTKNRSNATKKLV